MSLTSSMFVDNLYSDENKYYSPTISIPVSKLNLMDVFYEFADSYEEHYKNEIKDFQSITLAKSKAYKEQVKLYHAILAKKEEDNAKLAPAPAPIPAPISFDISHVESHEPSAFKDSSKFSTILNIGSKKNIKIVNFEMDICPVELMPVSGKCPEKFPLLNPHTNCCYKSLALKKGITEWKKTHGIKPDSVYTSNLDLYHKRATFTYNKEQTEAIIMYTYHGDRLMVNYTTNGFKVNKDTLTYFNQYSGSFPIQKGETLSEYCQRFYTTLVSSFIYPTQNHTILYRGINTDACKNYTSGAFIMINHFISSSIDESVATRYGDKGTILIIYVPRGTMICPIFDLSKYRQEKEILLNCGSIFYINTVSNKNSICYIEMTLVGRKELKE